MTEIRKFVPEPEVDTEKYRPSELSTEEDLIQFWLTFRRNNGLTLKDPKRELRAATLQAKETLDNAKKQDASHFFGIRADDRLIATGKLDIWTDDDNIKRGYLSTLTVDAEYRGKGLASDMTGIRTEKAKELGCAWVDTRVFIENPIALVTKFNDSYILRDIEPDAFILSKKIDDQTDHDPKKGRAGDLKEIQLTDLTQIKELLVDGFVCIDIKNIGDAKDSDPKLWTLIMEKR